MYDAALARPAMTMEQARCFVAVARELHFGRAADSLGFTQPAVSRLVQGLERSLGVKLLVRSSREVSLTAAGVALVPEAERALRSVQDAVAAARAAASGRSGSVRIGFTVLTAVTVLGEWVHRIKEQLPDVDLTLMEMVTDEQLTDLESGRLDLGVMRGEHARINLKTSVVYREDLVVALPDGHPLAVQEGDPTLAQIAELDLLQPSIAGAPSLGSAVAKLFRERGITPRMPVTARQIHTSVALVNAGLGAAIVPASAEQLTLPGVHFRAIGDADIPQAELRLAWRVDLSNPAAHACRDILIELAEKS